MMFVRHGFWEFSCDTCESGHTNIFVLEHNNAIKTFSIFTPVFSSKLSPTELLSSPTSPSADCHKLAIWLHTMLGIHYQTHMGVF